MLWNSGNGLRLAAGELERIARATGGDSALVRSLESIVPAAVYRSVMTAEGVRLRNRHAGKTRKKKAAGEELRNRHGHGNGHASYYGAGHATLAAFMASLAAHHDDDSRNRIWAAYLERHGTCCGTHDRWGAAAVPPWAVV